MKNKRFAHNFNDRLRKVKTWLEGKIQISNWKWKSDFRRKIRNKDMRDKFDFV